MQSATSSILPTKGAFSYPDCVIAELAESLFTFPTLSIDESALRSVPVDPFDLARSRRRVPFEGVVVECLAAQPEVVTEVVVAPASRRRVRSGGWKQGVLLASLGIVVGAALAYAGRTRHHDAPAVRVESATFVAS